MRKLLNTLYVTTQETRLSVDHNGIIAERIDSNERFRIPGNAIESILCFGNVSVTTPLIRYCGGNGISLSFYSETGRFYGRVSGPIQGNVLLRKEQYRILENDREKRLRTIKEIIDTKMRNGREVLMRAIRSAGSADVNDMAGDLLTMEDCLNRLEETDTEDVIRAYEGIAAKAYFDAFARLIKTDEPEMLFDGRSHHPPKDRINSLLSYVYTLLKNDIISALEAVGIDPECGYMHSLRPGRPAMALDIMEELRAPLCDRLVLTLINRRQIRANDFTEGENMFLLSEKARRCVLDAWQKRKRELIRHPVLDENLEIGLIPFAQAQLMARLIRGDEPYYRGFRWR